MLDGVLSLIPGAKVSAVGIARNEETLQAQTYLERLVGQLDQRLALIVDPMLATGGSMVATIDLLKKAGRSEEHTSELQSLMRISYAVFCLKKKKTQESNQIDMSKQ